MARSRQLTVLINGETYYAAQKAQEILEMTYSGLRYQVLTDNIKSEIPKEEDKPIIELKMWTN